MLQIPGCQLEFGSTGTASADLGQVAVSQREREGEREREPVQAVSFRLKVNAGRREHVQNLQVSLESSSSFLAI